MQNNNLNKETGDYSVHKKNKGSQAYKALENNHTWRRDSDKSCLPKGPKASVMGYGKNIGYTCRLKVRSHQTE